MTTIGNKLINVKIKSVKLEASNLSICVHNVDDSNVKLLESLLENAFDEECRYTDEEEVPVMGGLYVAQLKEGVHERCRVALCDKIGCTAKIRCIDSKIDRRLGFDQVFGLWARFVWTTNTIVLSYLIAAAYNCFN